MRFFNNRPYEDETDDELQALLKGIVYKAIARQYNLSSELDKYEKLIAELTRRGIEPKVTLQPKEAN